MCTARGRQDALSISVPRSSVSKFEDVPPVMEDNNRLRTVRLLRVSNRLDMKYRMTIIEQMFADICRLRPRDPLRRSSRTCSLLYDMYQIYDY